MGTSLHQYRLPAIRPEVFLAVALAFLPIFLLPLTTLGWGETMGGWTRVEHPTGSISDVIVMPDRAGSHTFIMVGIVGRGLWRSWDGVTWLPANEGLPRGALGQTTATLAADKDIGVIMAAVRDPTPGIYRSLDGGATWTLVSRGLDVSRVQAMGISPVSHNIYVLTSDRCYESSDQGETWAERGRWVGGKAITLAADPVQTDVLYLAADTGLYISRDRCGVWSRSVSWGERPSRGVALSARPRSVIYATDGERVDRSTDDGQTWQMVLTLQGQGWGIQPAIADLYADPDSSDIVLALTTGGLLWSTDGGASWQRSHPPRGQPPLTILRGAIPRGMILTGGRGGLWSVTLTLPVPPPTATPTPTATVTSTPTKTWGTATGTPIPTVTFTTTMMPSATATVTPSPAPPPSTATMTATPGLSSPTPTPRPGPPPPPPTSTPEPPTPTPRPPTPTAAPR